MIPRSGSHKVNGYVKAVLALDAVRRKREARYDRFVRPHRKRDELVADVSARMKALSGGQYAEAQRMLRAIVGPTSTAQRAKSRTRHASRTPTELRQPALSPGTTMIGVRETVNA